jgi:hypothetical protein
MSGHQRGRAAGDGGDDDSDSGAWWLTRDGDIGAENGIYGHSRFCNTDFDDKLACLNLSGV